MHIKNVYRLKEYGISVADIEQLFNRLKERYYIYNNNPKIKNISIDNFTINCIISIFSYSCGRYRTGLNTIELNFAQFDNRKEVRSTLTHELTHHIQYELNHNVFDNIKETANELGLDNYNLQPHEAEANIFAWLECGMERYPTMALLPLYHKVNNKISKAKKWGVKNV